MLSAKYISSESTLYLQQQWTSWGKTVQTKTGDLIGYHAQRPLEAVYILEDKKFMTIAKLFPFFWNPFLIDAGDGLLQQLQVS